MNFTPIHNIRYFPARLPFILSVVFAKDAKIKFHFVSNSFWQIRIRAISTRICLKRFRCEIVVRTSNIACVDFKRDFTAKESVATHVCLKRFRSKIVERTSNVASVDLERDFTAKKRILVERWSGWQAGTPQRTFGNIRRNRHRWCAEQILKKQELKKNWTLNHRHLLIKLQAVRIW